MGIRSYADKNTQSTLLTPKSLLFGHSGNMRVEESLRSGLDEGRIHLIAERTSAAVGVFNALVFEGKDVAGAFHLTC